MKPPTRPRAEDFLELVQKGKRGRLKLYIGFAAGVGKTCRMLEEAKALSKRGIDLVVGFVETHGRAGTDALLDGLDVLPRRRVEHRGIVVEDMDLDALLARAPAVTVVDELAHTNVPGSRHRKRYQDVVELLDAGINVIGAFNIQHLESLNDIVNRATGVIVRETVPDRFLKQADQVVNLDLTVEDLQERLRAGQIYAQDKIPWALEHFFTEENLAHLRELALREVAESVERSTTQDTTRNRVLVCLASSSPKASALLRRGSRLAGRFNTDWFALFVETPDETPEMIDSESQRGLLENLERAKELGAEVARLRAKDVVEGIMDFARAHAVRVIVVGRSRRAPWRQWLGRTIPLRLVREGAGFDVTVVSTDDDEDHDSGPSKGTS